MTGVIHYKDVEQWDWPNFTPKEMACKGTGLLLINRRAMDCIQAFRILAGEPVIILSAYRSPEHNKAVGGAPKSQHMLAKAFDIKITSSLTRERIHELGKKVGFTGFGDYNDFVHVDIGPKRVWDLRK